VTFPQNSDFSQHGTGMPQIQLNGDASVRFDIVNSCTANTLACGSGGAPTALTSWAFSDSLSGGVGSYMTRNVAWPTTVFVRVYRASAPTTCSTHTVTASRPAASAYQAGFTTGVVPFGTTTCTRWNAYRTSLDPTVTYGSITLNGSLDTVGRTCSGAAANTLCQALRAGGTAVSVSCGGITWSVGDCGTGNVEVTAGGPFCSCGATYAARPCHGDSNFGGLAGSSCGAANQTITVNCQPAPVLPRYSGNFTNGVAPIGTQACTDWTTFRSNISAGANYQTLRLNGSANSTGRQCNGAAANTLCQALRTGSAASVACNGTTWVVDGSCGNVELSASGAGCDCNAPYVARPCHGDGNFGGVDGINAGSGPTCNRATQTIGVSCEQSPTFLGSFAQGITPAPLQVCTDWNAFRASINAGFTYSSVTLSGSSNPLGFSCTGSAANTLCQALRTGANTGAVSCNGRSWSVGNCGGGMEISADGGLCTCASINVARPCHPNSDFGGLGGSDSCGEAAQTLQVNCQ
jgi:hypothetical protein